MALLKLFPTDYTTALSLLALFLFLVVSVIRRRVPRNFPPGPTPLPLIGNLHQLDLKKLDWSLMGLAEKYGNVFSVELGPLKAVVLTGYDAVKDALVNHADQFSGRPPIPIFDDFSFRTGVVLSDGKLWRENRKFVISALRGFGMGKKSIEDRISEEASFLVNVFESHKGQPFETARILNSAVSNIICSILFGDRFDYDNKIFNSLINMNNEMTTLTGTASIQLYNSYPSLGFLIPARRKMIENRDKMMEIFDSFFKAAEETLSENSIQTLNEALILRHQQESRGQDEEIQKRNTLMIIMDLFGAGTETTSTTVCWGLLLMMKYPDIQSKGISNFVFVSCCRCPNCYLIIWIGLSSLTSVLHDKTQWKTPKEFNPAHFLDADGNFVKRDAFMPFSAATRNKLGTAPGHRRQRRKMVDTDGILGEQDRESCIVCYQPSAMVKDISNQFEKILEWEREDPIAVVHVSTSNIAACVRPISNDQRHDDDCLVQGLGPMLLDTAEHYNHRRLQSALCRYLIDATVP
ncbi:cytochrome P450 2K6-like [Chiloscyllium plagiosum]|uniref:cytochrome P450 2K6-like n=1 Tax=Chiloscyllium plagiosum TaxID=36176 RepID=UPI001CB7E40C|nr:cytochrome P450 2K6-like [Chiloscyllium plagiosum]